MVVKIFISYSTKDGRKIAPIKKMIKDYPDVETFFADESMMPGDNIPENIRNEIKESDFLILFHSKNVQKSQWVQNEVGIAFGDKKLIVPLLLDKSKPQGLLKTNINYLDLTNKKKYDAGLKKLYHVIDKKKSEKKSDEIVLFGLGILALIGLFFGGKK